VVFNDYAGQVVPIEWHYWGGDPFYTFSWATADIQARSAYYGGWDYVPHFRYDGKQISDLFGTGPAYPEFFAFFRHTLDSLLTIPSPFKINLEQLVSEDWDSVYVSIDVIAVDSVLYDTTPDLYMAVVEEYHTYPGYSEWDYSFRDMKPDSDGEVITIQMGDSLHFDWVYPINAIYNQDAIITSVFVQNDPDGTVIPKQRNKVMQAASAKVVDVAGVSAGDQPSVIYLGKNSPNPFTTQTTISYALGIAGNVRLSVYSATGRLVTRLVDDDLQPGSYQATWDGRDSFGNEVGSGMYYYQLELDNLTRSGRMVILK
jgi:hypothetical protein